MKNAESEAQTRDMRLAPWYREARIGLFVHWGMQTGEYAEDPSGPEFRYRYEDVAEFEREAGQAGWHAGRWVSTAKRLQAKYITVASFHCELGYLKIWPSDVPGSPSTKRDYLGELIEAADSEGIRIVVYINRDAKNASHAGVVWLDREAYRTYKQDPAIDIAAPEGYLAYSIDVMEELLRRYSRIAGFWFDGYHDKEEAQAVFARLHRIRGDLVLINNDFSDAPVPDEDAMAIEDFGKIGEPAYDLASGTWVGPGDKEFAFKAKWDWVYLGEGRPHWKYYELNYARVPSDAELVRRIVTAAGNSWNANLGFGPKIGGDFPDVLETFVDHFERFLSWASESIHGTVGGGCGEGGLPPGHWNDGAYGVTTRTPGGETHYIHVLTPPSGMRLRLADAGYAVERAADLRTGEPLRYSQAEGWLTIDVTTWEATAREGDTVIKLFAAAERRAISPRLLTASASSELPFRPAARVLDGRANTFYRGAFAHGWPQHLTLKLAEPREVSGVCILQPETGPVTEGGYAAPVGERIRAYEIAVSEDGATWREAAAGELRNQRGMQVVPFAPRTASHVRLTARSNYAGTGTFQLVELELLTP